MASIREDFLRWAGAGFEVQFGGWGWIGEARPDEAWEAEGGGGVKPAMKQSSVRGPVTNT